MKQSAEESVQSQAPSARKRVALEGLELAVEEVAVEGGSHGAEGVPPRVTVAIGSI